MAGARCVDRLCVPGDGDAGGSIDAGVGDAGRSDAGTASDTGVDDAGAPSDAGFDADFDAGPPPASAAALELSFTQVKLFRFTWTDVDDATFYRVLEDADGSSGYTQVGGDIPQGTGQMDHEVPLHRRRNARYVLQSCNPAGCTDSAPVDVTGTLDAAVGYFKASNANADDEFRLSVSLSADGSTLAVGTRYEDSAATGIGDDESDDSAAEAGALYLY